MKPNITAISSLRAERSNLNTRKIFHIFAALMICLVFSLAGCATSKIGKAYDTLYASAVTRDAILTYAGDQWRAGEITDEQKIVIIELGERYYMALKTAQAAFKAYKVAQLCANEAQQEAKVNALADAMSAMSTAKEALGAYIKTTTQSNF